MRKATTEMKGKAKTKDTAKMKDTAKDEMKLEDEEEGREGDHRQRRMPQQKPGRRQRKMPWRRLKRKAKIRQVKVRNEMKDQVKGKAEKGSWAKKNAVVEVQDKTKK